MQRCDPPCGARRSRSRRNPACPHALLLPGRRTGGDLRPRARGGGGARGAAWWRREALSGGQVVEQATHVLDLARVLAGEVAEVVGATAPSSVEGRDVPDATAVVLRFDSGAVGTVSTSCVAPAPTAAGVEV